MSIGKAPDDPFVTVAEAAAILGIDARQVRRYADRLAPSDRTEDRTKTRAGRPVLMVRLSAVVALREGKSTQEALPADGIGTGHGQDKDSAGQDRDALLSELRARLADKDAEIARLALALEREQANTAAALAQSRDADQRLASVLAATGRLQVEAPKTADATAPDPGTGDTQPDREGEGGSTGRTESRGASWWARLWGRG